MRGKNNNDKEKEDKTKNDIREKLKIAKKKAKYEDNLEYDGERSTSTEERKKFIELLASMNKNGEEIDEESVELAINSMYLHPELINKGILKALIFNARKTNGQEGTQKILNSLLDCTRNTEYYEYLEKYKPWIKIIGSTLDVVQLNKNGLSNNEIANRLGLTSAEVSMILSGNWADFDPDDEERTK